MNIPVLVDLSLWLETERKIVVIQFALFVCRTCIVARARIRVLDEAVPLDHVSVALEVADADAEVAQLIRELSGELVDQALSAAETSLLAMAWRSSEPSRSA